MVKWAFSGCFSPPEVTLTLNATAPEALEYLKSMRDPTMSWHTGRGATFPKVLPG